MIVKIQRPLASSAPNPPALVYNKDRSMTAHMPITPDLAHLFKGGELKVYHEAKIEGDKLMIGRRVQNPGW